MGYSGVMTGGSLRPSNISPEEWNKMMEQQDEDAQCLISLYIKFGLIFLTLVIALEGILSIV